MQARTSSSRLPAKSLLPVNGIPLVEYCAHRVSKNSSIKNLIIATSSHPSDNYLSTILINKGYNIYRGDLKNVLSRFVDIIKLKNLRHNDVIIRLTADNPVVDGFFLDRMKDTYEREKLDYFSAEPEKLLIKNWPKGLSAEYFKVQMILDSFYADKSSKNSEHVTSFIRENCLNKKSMFDFMKFKENYIGISTGIDKFEDYINFVNIVCGNNIQTNLFFEKFLTYFKKV